MGLLRLILALNVVIAHSGSLFGIVSVGGMIAVKVFFIVSGFYMSLILNEKYTGEGAYKLFISNRILRLFPAYFFVCAIAVIFFTATLASPVGENVIEYWHQHVGSMDISAIIVLVLVSITLLGQELTVFTTINPATGMLNYTPSFLGGTILPYRFMLIPQAWTLSLELMFYIIAPLLVKRKSWIILLLMATSLGLRFWAYSNGYAHDPWDYRFFPFEIFFFLGGIISYKIYRKYKDINIPKPTIAFLLAAVFGYIVLYQYIPVNETFKHWSLCTAMIFAIPFLFIISKKNKFDRFIGELSYPVYICHVLIIQALTIVASHFHRPKAFTLYVIITTILFSILIIKFIMDPIENFRQNRIKKKESGTEEKPQPVLEEPIQAIPN